MNFSNYSTENETGAWDDEPLYEPPGFIIVFLSFMYGSISVIAIIGNGLVIWVVITSKRMRNVTNYFIVNLALADIVIGLFAIPFEAALLQRWVLPYFMCPFCPFIKVLSISVSVFTLSAIALDRYKAILKPLKARASRTQFKLVVSIIWIIGGIMGFPMAYGLRVKKDVVGELQYCTNVNLSINVMKYYHGIMVLFQYFLPLSVISFAYIRMALVLWGQRAPGNAQSERDARIMGNKKKVIKMLAIVVLLFAICWLPLQTYNLLQDITGINDYRYINIFWFSFDWLAMSNSCYNPFIYAIYNEKFRKEFQLRIKLPFLKNSNITKQLRRELSSFESTRSGWTVERTSTFESVKELQHINVDCT